MISSSRTRAGLPAYHDLGVIHCPGINLRRRKPTLIAGCDIVRGGRELLPEIVDCLNRNNARKQFAPLHDVESFIHGNRWKDFQPSDFFVALRNNHVVGVVGRWDQSAFKQTRVISYGKRLRWMVPAANAVQTLLGAPAFPEPGQYVPFFYMSFIAIDQDDVGAPAARVHRASEPHREGRLPEHRDQGTVKGPAPAGG